MEDIEIEIKKLSDRKSFIKLASEMFKKEPSTIETNWISKGYIPKADQETFYDLIVKYNLKQAE